MIRLFAVELRKSWKLFFRYPWNSFGFVATNIIIFWGILLGAKFVAGSGVNFGQRIESLIVGYMMWSVIMFLFNSFSMDIAEEAATGTLEQLLLNPRRLSTILFMRGLAELTLLLFYNLMTLVVILISAGKTLHFEWLALIPLFSVIITTYGLAFMISGIALIGKRIGGFLGILQFGLLFLIMAPADKMSNLAVFKFLPLTGSIQQARDVLAFQKALVPEEIGMAFANALLYLVLGILVLNWCESFAKRKGLLSGH